MTTQRIKGQEVQTAIIYQGVPVQSLDAVKSFDIEFELELLAEQYLGETSKRYDSIFHGVGGKADFHFATKDVFTLTDQIIQKAQRRTSGVTINFKATFNLPNGDRVRVQFSDVEFGPIPYKTGGREQYVVASVDFKTGKYKILS